MKIFEYRRGDFQFSSEKGKKLDFQIERGNSRINLIRFQYSGELDPTVSGNHIKDRKYHSGRKPSKFEMTKRKKINEKLQNRPGN